MSDGCDAEGRQPTGSGELRVSIVTVVLDGVEHLRDAVKSVLCQSYGNIEYIVVDGGSTDGTLEIIKDFDCEITQWISEPDQGIYDAMNKGVAMAQGEIVGILNADDYYSVKAVAAAVEQFMADSDVMLVHGAMRKVDGSGCTVATYGSKKGWPDWLTVPFNHPTCFVRRVAYERVGVFDPTYRIAGDYDWMLRFRHSGLKDSYVDDVLTYFRTTGVTSQSFGFPVSELWKVLRENGYPLSIAVAGLSVRWVRTGVVRLLSLRGFGGLRSAIRKGLSYHRL